MGFSKSPRHLFLSLFVVPQTNARIGAEEKQTPARRPPPAPNFPLSLAHEYANGASRRLRPALAAERMDGVPMKVAFFKEKRMRGRTPLAPRLGVAPFFRRCLSKWDALEKVRHGDSLRGFQKKKKGRKKKNGFG